MARVGSFGGPDTSFANPLSVVHPLDSVIPKDVKLDLDDLTEQQREDLQALLRMLEESARR